MYRKVDLEQDRCCGCFGGPESQGEGAASSEMGGNVLLLSLCLSVLWVIWFKISRSRERKLDCPRLGEEGWG